MPNFSSTLGAIHLTASDFLAQGGEGIIYTVPGHPDRVAKIFLKDAHLRRRKLEAMLANPPSDPAADQGLRHRAIAWPTHLLHLPGGEFAGFLMPRIAGQQPLANIYNPRDRRTRLPAWTWRYLLGTAKNLAAVVHALHERGYIIGDLNESNASVRDNALVTIYDCDSFQVTTPDGRVHRNGVGKAEYTPAELQGVELRDVDRHEEHDRFALAVLLYQLLMEGVHPFTGRWQGPGEPPLPEENIKRGHYHHRPRGKLLPPPSAVPLEHLRPALRELFHLAFVAGHDHPRQRPGPAVWKTALEDAAKEMRDCPRNKLHVFGGHLPACPWCARAASLGRDPSFPNPLDPVKSRPTPAPTPPRSQPVPTPAAPRPAVTGWAVLALAAGFFAFAFGTPTPGGPAEARHGLGTYLAIGGGALVLFFGGLGIWRRQVGRAAGVMLTLLALDLALAAVNDGFNTYTRESAAMAEAKAKVAAAKAEVEAVLIAAASKEQPWQNSLGMRFVPVAGTDVLFSIWDVRVQDYEAFEQAIGGGLGWGWVKPSFAQGPTHPAVNVSWNDAQAFCQWLTERDRQAGRLGTRQSYRLPADWEWSVAVGLNEARGGTPESKSMKIANVYPWGRQWPPPPGAGNYDSSLGVDSFANTSPVGSFTANAFGLYDLGGNVWQWCEDFYNGSSGSRVLRGGSWNDGVSGGLLSSYRGKHTSVICVHNIGFRCVLVGVSSR